MHLRIDQDLLKAMMGEVIDAVCRTSTIPIIGHVLLEAQGNAVAITATNLDMQVRTTRRDDNLDGSGSVTVNGDLLHKIAQKLPKGEVQLSRLEDGRILLNSATGSQFHLSALPPGDFPLMEFADGVRPDSNGFTIPGGHLAQLIARTLHAASNEETRFYLNGIYLHRVEIPDCEQQCAKQVLRAVTTDGHRLAMTEIELPEGAEDMPGIILPIKAAQLALKLFKDCASVALVINERLIEIASPSTILTSKLVDAAYPDYGRVLPSAQPTPILTQRENLSDALARMMLLPAGKKSRGVRLALELDGAMTLTSNDGNGQDGFEPVPVSYTGDKLEVGFNGAYLLDVIDRLEGAEVELHMKDSASPALIMDPASRDTRHVIMPMRV